MISTLTISGFNVLADRCIHVLNFMWIMKRWDSIGQGVSSNNRAVGRSSIKLY